LLERRVIPKKNMENFYKMHMKPLRKQKGNSSNLQEEISGQHRKFLEGRGGFLDSSRKIF